MSKRPNIQEVITFLKNPTFGAFLQDTRNRIEDYEKKLRKKDPKMNVLQYNEYDMIRDNIETLENYLREPSRLL
jgi:tRNA nucleotidyltransferase (CCA-adding enzyme)